MFELKHLRSLLALKSQGSLAAAADALHISQSALSHQLTELELRLARPLFLRKSRPLRFTADGMKLVALAESVLPPIDELVCQAYQPVSVISSTDGTGVAAGTAVVFA